MPIELIQADIATAEQVKRGKWHWDVAYYNPATNEGGVIRVRDGIPLDELQEGVAAALEIPLEDLSKNFALAARHSRIGIVMNLGIILPEGEKDGLAILLSGTIQT